ncbi:MAG: hypothetical protein LV473_06575 [Nitrospira sp.]|nr:hypothetical protein [Nitrospira sp.]
MLSAGHRYIGVIFFCTVVTIASPGPSWADLDDISPSLYNLVNRIFRPAPEEDIAKYRRRWNPFAAGPMLNPAIDIQPKGQTVVHPYVFGEIGHMRSGNQLTAGNFFGGPSNDSPFHLNASLFLLPIEYGLTDSLEVDIAFSWVDWFATQQNFDQNSTRNANGLGDTTIFMKHRPIIQDHDTWRPSVTFYHSISLPSSDWANTTGIPGGFAPFGRLPSTRFGDLEFTEGIMMRKNIRPFRFEAAAYYSYGTPGSKDGMNTYGGDLVNWRLSMEHVLDDSKGFGYIIEVVGLHGLGWRLDGHSINIPAPGQTSNPTFSMIGVQPSFEYKFSNNIVIAGGVLFTVASQNQIDAVYPNFTLYYYWGSKGRPVIMR